MSFQYTYPCGWIKDESNISTQEMKHLLEGPDILLPSWSVLSVHKHHGPGSVTVL